MSEIKFACPHCNQHIACDIDYSSLTIDCPGCGGSVVVPGWATFQRPESLTVAPTSPAQGTPVTQGPAFGAWTKEQLQHRYDEALGATSRPSPLWLLAAIGTVIFAVILGANRSGFWMITLCLLVGGIISGVLAAESRRVRSSGPVINPILKVLLYILAAIVILPCLALGILLVGCGVCR